MSLREELDQLRLRLREDAQMLDDALNGNLNPCECDVPKELMRALSECGAKEAILHLLGEGVAAYHSAGHRREALTQSLTEGVARLVQDRPPA